MFLRNEALFSVLPLQEEILSKRSMTLRSTRLSSTARTWASSEFIGAISKPSSFSDLLRHETTPLLAIFRVRVRQNWIGSLFSLGWRTKACSASVANVLYRGEKKWKSGKIVCLRHQRAACVCVSSLCNIVLLCIGLFRKIKSFLSLPNLKNLLFFFVHFFNFKP